jgi:hypothetical protein
VKRLLLRILSVLALLTAAPRAFAQNAPDAPDAPSPSDERHEQARARFEAGLAHFDRAEWSAALGEFLRSREILPTRSATINAAACLRKEARYDEALDLLEELLRTYPDLAAEERAVAQKDVAELRRSVGSIDPVGAEPGATIIVDGRVRGIFPPSSPIRVTSGARLVRIYKEGYVPFERRVDVGRREAVMLDARLAPLTGGGRLNVAESSGAALDVLVDDILVGKTPWEGKLAAGTHTVALRGVGDQGTPPTETTVTRDEVTRLALSAETLDASLRVVPVPATAFVSIDGVAVGRGVWEGPLRPGPHRIALSSAGFLGHTRDAVLVKGQRSSLPITLVERDTSGEGLAAMFSGRPFAEVDGGTGVGLVFGGDVRDACTGNCSAMAPVVLGVTLRGGIQLRSGLMVGLDAGLLAISAGTTGRATSLQPRGLPANPGTTDDALYLHGLRVGPSVGYVFGKRFPVVTVRLAAGALFASAGDNRSGSFTTSGGALYEIGLSESARARYLYAAPEARVGARPFDQGPLRGLEVSLGLEVMLLTALDHPTWTDAQPVLAAPSGQRGDGLATFGSQTLAGSFVANALPTLGLRYTF